MTGWRERTERLTEKNEIIKTARKLADDGLIVRSWGNVSCRAGGGSFFITASGRDYRSMGEDDIAEVSVSDLSFRKGVVPSSEMRVHREVYRIKEDAGFVIHTHQSNASAVSAMGIREVMLKQGRAFPSGKVICADYGPSGSAELAEACASAAAETEGRAVIMRNHGALCWGRDAAEALEAAQELEKLCGDHLELMGIEQWKKEEKNTGAYRDEEGRLWNRHPVVLKITEERDRLCAYLDDFAQIAGAFADIKTDLKEDDIKTAEEQSVPLLIKGMGALCQAARPEDEEALFAVTEKNCRAALAGWAAGAKPLDSRSCILMREKYVNSYSRLFK